ncbi:transcription-repair coupling factor [Thalassotalea sp. M1531]|uniref:Transcription-repair-coupling factor n=1 Tax=Thalassotalea algicola TaxID=2716224 RepID=A0A7Y0LFV3_9GAMM|nr:transcription-repair coupling factor [Thalassotalea algicola]NMP33494.1 transcription-repair coupling factor [Thalassotalea algicola]
MSNFTPLLAPQLTQTTTDKSDKKEWVNLPGSSASLALYQAALKEEMPILVITHDTPSAIHLEQEVLSLNIDNSVDVCLFPDWETLPYDSFSPHQDIISQRLATLYALSRMSKGIVIVPVTTLVQRLSPKSYIDANTLLIKKGDKKDLHQLRIELEASGYRNVDQVMEHGEFSARGAIIDLYPMGSDAPYRLDFFDDEIEEIRLFDPETQRSSDKVALINLLPAHEFPTDTDGINLFRSQYREQFTSTIDKESVYHQVSNGIMPAGIEYYLPLFFNDTNTLFDYLPQNILPFIFGDIEDALTHYWHDIDYRYEDRRYDPTRPLLPPEKLFLSVDQLFSALKPLNRITVSPAKPPRKKVSHILFETEPVPELAVDHQLKEPFSALNQFMASNKKSRFLFVAESQGRRESVLELLKRNEIKPEQINSLHQFVEDTTAIAITVNALSSGFCFKNNGEKIVVITEAELLGDRVKQSRRRSKQQDVQADAIFKNLAELTSGQPVVHIDHGIGRYLGLQTIDTGGITTEFLTLSYANDAKLYVPVASLHLISRYSGNDPEHAPLHKLGNDTWTKAKKKAAEKVKDVAAELLDVYAKRASKKGYQFKRNKEDYLSFADSFGFEETLDQEQAIHAVVSDMLDKKPMDRLVCGDVGFGKTEVAMRAAFVAVNDGKQVALLVPTTLLAQQHYDNFRDRFANWPVSIEVLSRFKTTKEQNAVIEKVESGQIDILIGTHKLLQNTIKYHDLGLLIVDEEHRFGVKQKEKIKQLRSDIDILTLTATPIPRTLNMAMGGMRDLSIIATPPAKRLAVKTFVRQREDALIRESILREILRGGQVYFLHNNVDTIEKTARDLETLVPEAKVVTAHGQMRERELERIMSDFYHQRFNVLVCTTIIETGIDVPSANTIIMDRADNLGLAQLHQLRGRVGRSHHQAYAYLLTPHEKRMTKDAKKRLEAIASLEDLGAGFTLATHDLEIRGAGELLGEDQSGQMSQVGFSLYMEMLDQAVAALKSGKEPSLENLTANQAEVDLRIPALLPDDYIFDVSLRLSLYKRIASCTDKESLDEIQVELIDRFGLLPQATKNLVHIAKLKLKAQKLGIARIEVGPASGSLEFSDETKVDPVKIIGLIQQQPKTYKLDGANKLKIVKATEDAAQRFSLVNSILAELTKR